MSGISRVTLQNQGFNFVLINSPLDVVSALIQTQALHSKTVQAQGQETFPEVDLLGVPVHCITEQQCIDFIMNCLDRDMGGWVATHNLDHLRRLRRDRSFRDICATASLRVADGMPLVWAGALQGTPFPERVTGSNLISSLSGACAAQGRSIFLLGGESGTAAEAAGRLCDRYPDLQVAGTLCPKPGFHEDPAQCASVLECLRQHNPDVVFVALGSPLQENMIDQWRRELPHVWWLGVGISFSFLSGHVQRAPLWMQRLGLEWTHRLMQEPRRLWRRYLVDGAPFAIRLLVASIGARARNAIGRT